MINSVRKRAGSFTASANGDLGDVVRVGPNEVGSAKREYMTSIPWRLTLDYSSILHSPRHIMTSTVPQRAGTRRRRCMKPSAKTIPPSGCAPMARQNSEMKCCSQCSLGELFSACKASSDKMYVLADRVPRVSEEDEEEEK